MMFQELITQALAVRAKYAKLENTRYGREWTGEELMLGFMKDVGDLAKLIQVKEGVREAANVDEALAHELSDCLWSTIIIADKYGIDLGAAFAKTMKELNERLNANA